MTAKNIKTNKAQAGFTLIELLVVIGILAILLAITLIAINPARQFAQGRDTSRRNTATQILNAVGGYFADHGGTLPTGINGSTTNQYFLISSASTPGLCENLVPNYIPAIAQNPSMTSASDITNSTGGTCASGWNAGYYIMRDANNRITVTSTSEVYTLDQTGNQYITVTR